MDCICINVYVYLSVYYLMLLSLISELYSSLSVELEAHGEALLIDFAFRYYQPICKLIDISVIKCNSINDITEGESNKNQNRVLTSEEILREYCTRHSIGSIIRDDFKNETVKGFFVAFQCLSELRRLNTCSE